MRSSPEPAGRAADPFGGRADPGEGLVVDGSRIYFPPRAAWLSLRLDAPPGTYALALDFAQPASLHIEVVTAAGTIPLPPEPRARRLAVTFAVCARLEAVRFLPIDEGWLNVAAVDFRTADPWRSLLPDWPLGPLTLPPRPPGEAAATVRMEPPLRPPSWDRGMAIAAAEAVTVAGECFHLGAAGVLSLALDPPLPAGRHRIEGRFLGASGEDARVQPAILLPGQARDPRDAATVLVGGRDGHRSGVLHLAQPAHRILLRPREERGLVRIESLSVRPAAGWRGRLPTRRHPARVLDGLAPRDRLALRSAAGLRGARRAGARSAAARPLAQAPLVSVVTPTRDGADHLARYLATIAHTEGRALEIVLVDNGTADPAALSLLEDAARRPNVRILTDDRPFNFAALSNRGAAVAAGRVLVFANNDVAFLWPDWLERLAAVVEDPAVGVAGARLLYPTGRVQHAGVVLAGEARARHTKRPLRCDRSGEARPVAAVTGALMALRADLFHDLGGFRADRYPVLYNDIDLCLRARGEGRVNVLVPRARAVHHEWATTARLGASADLFARGGPLWRHARAQEADRFRQDWAAMLDRDPCYPAHCDALAADFRQL